MTRDIQYPPMFGAAGEPFSEERKGLVLVGFIVRSGEVIDAITPLYRQLTETGELSQALFRGARAGGEGGVEYVALMDGCAISSLQYRASSYFGHASIMELRLGFRHFSKGECSGEERCSKTFSSTIKQPREENQEVFASSGVGFVGMYGNASAYINCLDLFSPETPQLNAKMEGLTKTTLTELYQSNEQSAKAARLKAQESVREEEAQETLHQADRQRTTERLRVWLHNGALSVEGVTSFFLRGWDTGAYEERLRLLAAGSLLRVTFTCKAEVSFLVLRLNHLSADLEGRVGYSPITITLNKQAAVKELSPPHDYYTTERFELSSYLKPGENILEITLGDAASHYWLESLEVLY